ncbi:glycoside hydrolase family 97 protein [Microbulbifer rhizosphaerae]|uniref:Alpha-glucosidase n=1 Tax=Microbulbifer rhizosphaerae TaxID=1562603 RepID=A0A7W4WDX6_9GAMM|nr:glycoside hydrolase family 97 protein [Microbulbifer rhizosphaerae]MBB3062464.1 alpha-glucosidase [Microbulbifer rhizosphaerae]
MIRIARQLSLAFLLALSATPPAQAKTVTANSPDGNIVVTLSDEGDAITYRIAYGDQVVVDTSPLGISFKNTHPLGPSFAIDSVEKKSRDQTWEQPWGERRLVRDHHQELLVRLRHPERKEDEFALRFRLFNDGVGFRYEIDNREPDRQAVITRELTEFRIPAAEKTAAWWIPGRGWNRYEYIYRQTSLAEIDRAHTPLTLKLDSGIHLSIHEAALVDYAAMVLDQGRPGNLRADLTPWSHGARVVLSGPFKTPWRTVQISQGAIGLLNSDLILNLNEPNKLGDVSWVKPGKYMGIWWGMHLDQYTWASGDRHGATTERTKEYMDFAGKYGFSGVLVEGWNKGWDGDWFHNGDIFRFAEPYPDFDLKAVTEYGRARGVELIGHHETSGSVSNYAQQMDAALDLYRDLGVNQVKTGYVADGGDIKRIDENGIVRYEWHDSQFMVNEYLRNVTEAAKRKICINTHEPVKDTGLRRTYPNWLSREGARGQEFNAWGQPPNPPEHEVVLAYTRMLSGPMDFTPGIFDLAPKGLDADIRVKTTLAKQLALYVVLYSPVQMAADLPENYLERPDAFQFIVDVPVDWEQSIALAGEVGDHVVFARRERGGEDWYIGGITGADAREITFDLDFLDEGKSYRAQIYRDGDKADWKTNPYDLVIENKTVGRGDQLTLRMARSGGAAIHVKALE